MRTFLANYPGLKFRRPAAGDHVLDIAFGDGRNTAFLCDQGFAVSGIEITQGIVDQTCERLETLGHAADLRVGRNSDIPFDNEYFDYILACHCCYYCDEGESFADNLAEYARVLKRGGYLVASVACKSSYIFKDAVELADGSLMINADPYGNRNGYRLHAFSEKSEIEKYFSPHFSNFSFGFADNNYYDVSERVFWVVCQKS
ncbi:methyltransferase [Cupriavidus basilensis OR16]|uniref:Methyltransferase n=1 Tax=Cupriavidus basilensis OR16 TaxID=1127483 RepID=H1SAF7_9BURK|nr:methyltransferase [Cupriavidus basilensis OR16]